jgi:hypothetical protein
MKKYVESPIDVHDLETSLTKGKKYETSQGNTYMTFRINDDRGNELYCLYTGCAHLNLLNWIKL